MGVFIAVPETTTEGFLRSEGSPDSILVLWFWIEMSQEHSCLHIGPFVERQHSMWCYTGLHLKIQWISLVPLTFLNTVVHINTNMAC